jgi:uncharacterized membrane protein SpoIIM required for sporulation
MNIKRWVARREPSWQQLEQLLQQIEKKGLKSLQANGIRQLASLYRSVSADLARAQTRQVGQDLTQTLQRLTVRAYSQIYQGKQQQTIGAVAHFYRTEFPGAVQDAALAISLATAMFGLGALVGWWLSWSDPAFMALVVPDSIISQVRDRHELWMGAILGWEPLSSAGIMINNLMVSFRAIAGGLIFGLFTLFAMFYNGLLIGSIGTLVSQNNLAIPFWAFVFPHGSLELPAIFFAGGAGLQLGRAVLFPGRYRRIDAIKFYGQQAAVLTGGIIPMLIIAGVIESFISPQLFIPDVLKYSIGIALFTLLILYCSKPIIKPSK